MTLDVVKLLLGIGGPLAIVILFLAWLVRGAIATAIKQAGDAELVRLKGELDSEIESKRQGFQTTLETERAALQVLLAAQRQLFERALDESRDPGQRGLAPRRNGEAARLHKSGDPHGSVVRAPDRDAVSTVCDRHAS